MGRTRGKGKLAGSLTTENIGDTKAEKKAPKAVARRKPAEPEIVEKANVRELFEYVKEAGSRGYEKTRYKGLGEMNSEQLWQTTMDPERRTLLSVKLEDLAECETIFSTLMGEDVEARRKFIEDNALDVKNLDILSVLIVFGAGALARQGPQRQILTGNRSVARIGVL